MYGQASLTFSAPNQTHGEQHTHSELHCWQTPVIVLCFKLAGVLAIQQHVFNREREVRNESQSTFD